MSTMQTMNKCSKEITCIHFTGGKEKHVRDHFCRVAILRTALLLTVEQVMVTTCNGGLGGGRGEEEALE